METALNVVFWVFVTISFGVVFSVMLPTLFNYLRVKKTKNIKSGDVSQLVQMFLSAGVSDNSGRMYVNLINKGFFTSLRTDNHSKTFDDIKQLEDFRKSGTSDISNALKKVGELYERYYV